MSGNKPRQIQSISVFGLGKLGAVVAGCHAAKGFRVIGVDVNSVAVESCQRGVPPVEEPGIEKLYAEARELLTATTDGAEAVSRTDASLIVVPTPSEEDGAYSLQYALGVCDLIGVALRGKSDYHLVVLKSTVLPGSCDEHVVPRLEARSGKRCGIDFGLCYNPEFIALGSVIHNIFNPDSILIGESDSRAGDALVDVYERLLDGRRPTARMNFANAELAKLAVNTYVTMKITYANLLAHLCEHLPGGDVDAVTGALGLDSRIGRKYIKGGLGYGGPCFPRDNRAMLCLARRLGVPFGLAEATDEANREMTVRVAELVAAKTPAQGKVAILGLSYKPNTAVVDESQGVLIAHRLTGRGLEITAYDPMAMDSARRVLRDGVKCAESAQACITNADVILIATPWEEFRDLDYNPVKGAKRPLIIDCWGLLDGLDRAKADILKLGVHDGPRARS
jgi:UDPglucose 6-dehydrogenase